MVSRRGFIVTGSVAAIAASAAVGSGSSVVAGLGSSIGGEAQTLSSDFFKRQLMMDFQVEGFNTIGPTTMRLIDVKDTAFENDPAGVKREGFSLLFKSNGRKLIPQDTYRFRNPAFGSRNMFTAPVTSEKGVYEVVFNRLNS